MITIKCSHTVTFSFAYRKMSDKRKHDEDNSPPLSPYNMQPSVTSTPTRNIRKQNKQSNNTTTTDIITTIPSTRTINPPTPNPHTTSGIKPIGNVQLNPRNNPLTHTSIASTSKTLLPKGHTSKQQTAQYDPLKYLNKVLSNINATAANPNKNARVSHTVTATTTTTANLVIPSTSKQESARIITTQTIKEEPGTTLQPTKKRKVGFSSGEDVDRYTEELKEQGLIRISIHRANKYTTQEMAHIMKQLGVVKVISSECTKRLIIALVKTTDLRNIDADHNPLNRTLDMNEDVFPLFDQGTQITPDMLNIYRDQHTQTDTIHKVNMGIQTEEKKIDKTQQTYAIAESPVFNIPDLIEHNVFVSTMIKPMNVFFNTDAVKNYTQYDIPESVAIVLSFGPKFSLPIYYKQEDFTRLRDAAFNLNEIFGQQSEQSEIKEAIMNHVKEYSERQFEQHSSEIRDYFTAAISETQAFIKEHPDIIVTQADKANSAIIMDRDTYIAKVEKLLSDKTTYSPLKISSIAAYQLLNKAIIEKFTKANLISEVAAHSAIRNETGTANLYCLIKTHKDGHPPRPIVNTRNTPGYLLSSKVTEILTKARDTIKYNVFNSTQATERIKSSIILPDEEFDSLDARSMFTNISTQKALLAVKKRQFTPIQSTELKNLITEAIEFICIKSAEIKFNGRLYKQIKGLRMGSSISPILADFVLEDLLDSLFKKIDKPSVIIKYVDDIMMATTPKHTEEILKAINEADPELKFDLEKQGENRRINYLDFTIINDPFDLKTIWFQKPIASGRFLNFLSHHPKTVIWNTAVAYVVTMIQNSSPTFHNEIIRKAKHLLKINSYPYKYSENVITKALEKVTLRLPIMNTQTQSQTDAIPITKESKNYVGSLPHIPKLTEPIRNIIEEGAEEDISLASRPQKTMSQQVYNKHKRIKPSTEIETIDISQEINELINEARNTSTTSQPQGPSQAQ